MRTKTPVGNGAGTVLLNMSVLGCVNCGATENRCPSTKNMTQAKMMPTITLKNIRIAKGNPLLIIASKQSLMPPWCLASLKSLSTRASRSTRRELTEFPMMNPK
mmetsp:Transcript_290/g.738  ORF Transcript_290/g.738 Transcript_290/m.738 type:complete len:104 (+) Transcript_290:73-384(+)